MAQSPIKIQKVEGQSTTSFKELNLVPRDPKYLTLKPRGSRATLMLGCLWVFLKIIH